MSIFGRRKPAPATAASEPAAPAIPEPGIPDQHQSAAQQPPADKPLGREAARRAALSLAAAVGPALVALLEWWARTR
ncbi:MULTISPECIES: hypothetical protein [unclassified Streptomyces]|uniref:hypothetical protein n=1 Tax=unclassified Streptomyces TaxID=2593676 RepID=UPI0004C61DFF|nr:MULTISPECIES: hypothetical protein [unclassified Streptomyces]